MAQQTKSPVKTWTKPQLERLGKIADVAGPNGAAAQSPVQNRS
jgi:hypothetical protein